MSDTAKPEPAPFEKFREAMKHILTVPKAEVLRREEEYRKARGLKAKKKDGDGRVG